jgi:hypothetical protein
LPALIAKALPVCILLGMLYLAAWLLTGGAIALSRTTKVFMAMVLLLISLVLGVLLAQSYFGLRLNP